MYNKEESLSLTTIERHIHEQKNHKESLLSTIEKDYTNIIKERQNEWLREDSDPSYKNQKIDKEIATLKGIKTVTPG